jgi:hypothetical protein
MAAFGFSTAPASLWRAFFVGILTLGGTGATAAPGNAHQPATPFLQLGRPDQAEGARALGRLRRQGIAGSYFLEFQLRLMPRRGAEQLYAGMMWGGQNGLGTISRVQLAPGTPAARRLLIQNGPQPAVWQLSPGAAQPELLGGRSLLQPMIAGTDLTPFDLQMPFIHWPDFVYEGLTRFRGRPAHVFLLRPPPEFATGNPELRGVRVQLDSQFNALVQVELLGAGDLVTKTTTVVDLKKVADQWIVKTIDVRDEVTRDKTRLSVTAAALGLDFSGALFEPAQLTGDVPPPAAAAITRIAP